MSYLYEQLGDERFQHLAQSVLTTAFPNTQCLPVNQPDGGRDAFVRAGDRPDGIIVFQVKFTKNPADKTEREAIVDFVESEGAKVAKLKKRGVKAYYLITNISGTAHPDAGSIDKLNEALSTALDLPSFCWWRDDLDARINANASIKWSFPEITRGSDLLQALYSALDQDHGDARRTALRAYIASQHRDDSEVKFKQVEIQNKLLDLFVDLPIGLSDGPFRYHHTSTFVFEETEVDGAVVIRPTPHHGNNPNAATFLLSQPLVDGTRRLILEGAPGQGKSTITQYICQANRIRLLNSAEKEKLSLEHQRAPVRVPFRIDLRDYAAWLSGRDPFAAEPNTRLPPQTIQSLENLIATQVAHVSGGHAFHVADLIAILKESHALIVLDGFDEVADIPLRQRLVDEIGRAAARIASTSKSVMLIVTSRPAAFANSPGFPEREWRHYSLQAMTVPQIELYSKRWTAARQLAALEAREIQRVLSEKLEQAHMRDLAKNPMQLAILLALISTRGMSLPDKRTALYDSYMELFFSREAEKSAIVREQRDLLLNIHRYLAWVLQTEAEKPGGSGSISDARLKELLTSYLDGEGHDTNLVDDLFQGMIERVVALVSRVQGTYEFEVQPLREYFAGRFLYETAPYSPPGQDKRGSKPERFDALVRNFYWLNATRFYCGCYSTGELASLVDGMEELNNSGDFGLLSYPRSLAFMLLGDWVFSQRPHAVNRVLDQALREPGLSVLLATDSGPERGARFALPDRCGRKELLSRLVETLNAPTSHDQRVSYCTLIIANTSQSERISVWQSIKGKTVSEWLSLGLMLKVFHSMPLESIASLSAELGPKLARSLALSGRWDAIYANETLFRSVAKLVIEGGYFANPRSDRAMPPLQKLSWTLSHHAYAPIFRGGGTNGGIPLNVTWGLGTDVPDENAKSAYAQEQDQEILQFFETIDTVVQLEVDTWASSLDPWHRVYEAGLSSFGGARGLARFALLSAAIRAADVPGTWDTDAWKVSPRLCERLRFARLKSGNAQWWRDQLCSVRGDEEVGLAAATFALFATPRTMEAVGDVATDLFNRLDEAGLAGITETFSDVFDVVGPSAKWLGVSTAQLRVASCAPIAFFLSRRSRDPYARELYSNHLAHYRGSNREMASHVASVAVRDATQVPKHWDHALEVVRHARGMGAALHYIQELSPKALPEKVARTICANAQQYPRTIIRVAERRLASVAGARAPKLGDVARTQSWFA